MPTVSWDSELAELNICQKVSWEQTATALKEQKYCKEASFSRSVVLFTEKYSIYSSNGRHIDLPPNFTTWTKRCNTWWQLCINNNLLFFVLYQIALSKTDCAANLPFTLENILREKHTHSLVFHSMHSVLFQESLKCT